MGLRRRELQVIFEIIHYFFPEVQTLTDEDDFKFKYFPSEVGPNIKQQ